MHFCKLDNLEDVKMDWKRLLMIYGGGWIAMGILHEIGHIIFGGGLISLEYGVGWQYGGILQFDSFSIWLPGWCVYPIYCTIPMYLGGFFFSLAVPIYLWYIKERTAAVILLLLGFLSSIYDFIQVVSMI